MMCPERGPQSKLVYENQTNQYDFDSIKFQTRNPNFFPFSKFPFIKNVCNFVLKSVIKIENFTKIRVQN